MAASVYLQKVEMMMDAWMTYSKAKSRCTLAVRCSVCATVNCRNALSMACRTAHQLVFQRWTKMEGACMAQTRKACMAELVDNYHTIQFVVP